MTQPYGGINLHCCHQKLVAKIESTPAVSLLNPRVPETSAGSPDVLQAMLLLAPAEARAKTANEVALAAEKANYAAAEEVERLREVLHSPEPRGGCY